MSQEVNVNPEAKTAVFRKKTSKGSRPKTSSRKGDDDDDSPDENGVKQLDLEMIKAQQVLREKNKRIPAASGDSQKTSKKDPILLKSNDQTSIGAHFSVQVDNGYGSAGGGIHHEKLMNQYIDEKLGLSSSSSIKEEKEKPAYLIEEEKLYKVPDYIKVTSQQSIVKDLVSEDSEHGIKASWSTGIAEVSLPVNYKLKNIEETERLLREKGLPSLSELSGPTMTAGAPLIPLPDREAVQQSDFTKRPAYYQRFQIIDRGFNTSAVSSDRDPHTELLHALDQQSKGIATMADSLPTTTTTRTAPVPGGAGTGTVGLKRSQQSSDDAAMARFKKNQMQFLRNR